MIDLPDYPEKAVDLNAWVKAHFMVFEGPGRSYFELPFPVRVGWAGEEKGTETLHRVSYLSLSFRGTEADCCKAIAAHLYLCVSREIWMDAIEAVFVRTYFTYTDSENFGVMESKVAGRLAFWRQDLNRKLMSQAVFRPEGALASIAQLPPNFWDRQ